MYPKLKPFLYGLGVFSVYALLTFILRWSFNKMPLDAEYFGVYTTNDLLIGIVVAVVLTFSHERKKKLND
jgi:hypothetical protein